MKKILNSHPEKLLKLLLTGGLVVLLTFIIGNAWLLNAGAQTADAPPRPMAPLSTVSVPDPGNLSEFIQNRSAAIALGKALFWDMQVGSDGVQSCASCHFHAGVDNRSKNQLTPGCEACPSGPDGYSFGGPNYQSQRGDFPYHKLSDPNNRNSSVIYDRNEVTSSQGVFKTKFQGLIAGSDKEQVGVIFDPIFSIGGTNTRRVEPRSTPTFINSVFFFRNFWDGRAQNRFNGVDPFGDDSPNARVLKNSLLGMSPVRISMTNASIASLATGPPLSTNEMSAEGRTFPLIGKKLLNLTPLAKQTVASDDSVLAGYRSSTGKGLNQTYANLIKAAFRSEWLNSTKRVNFAANGLPSVSSTGEFSQMEANFSLYFGIAMQLYAATQVSGESPVDKYLAGNTSALTDEQKLGKSIFEGKGNCASCHEGAEFSNATISAAQRTEFMNMAVGSATYDTGFYNIGVRPTGEDLGVGGINPFGKPLSFSRRQTSGRVAVDGAFKVPSLRNVELTAPYFHNGGQLTLEQVVEFYNRGGDFHEANIQNLDPEIESLNLTTTERAALVAFLKGLTDDRVRYHQAPFDHPSLQITNGHPGDTGSVTSDGKGQATDSFIQIPAIGKNGGGYSTTQTVTETRYKTEYQWGITGYFLLIPIYGWKQVQVPYTVQVTKTVWVPQAPTTSFLQ